MSSAPDGKLSAGQEHLGFTILRVTPVPEIRATAYELEHDASGAHLLHLHADDAENLFSISFRTPPPDDTGVPHIIEHSVLAGSERFPVRDPFFEMVKMSMATFINAMTAPDCTYYPVSSNVKNDLFNLAEVYFDAVFHPLLSEDTLKKEGHHLVPADPEKPLGELKVNGIVYNEMKSASSSPDALLYYNLKSNLLPDSIYGRHSGGDPKAIPDLTFEGFKGFYDFAYHPSNAYFVLYGDIPTTEYLAFLAERLAGYERQDVPPPIAPQPRWTKPRELVETYPIGPDDKAEEKTYLVMQWLAGDATDPVDSMMLGLLDRILFGNEAAPMKKALIASKLGQDLTFSGAFTIGREGAFGVGLKGSESDRAEAFCKLTLDELAKLADDTFAGELVEAAFQQTAYHFLEINQMYPLHMMDRVLHSWIYGNDPLALLNASGHLAACRERYEKNPRIFNELIRERLLDNPHRLDMTLKPDRKMQARTDAEFADRMTKLRATKTDDQMREIAAEAAELQRQAGTPNTPEAIATLPQLTRSDLPEKPREIPTSVEDLGGGTKLLCNDVFANGVNYLRFELDLGALPPDLWSFMPRFTEAIRKLGAADSDYEEMARRISSNTGGVWAHPTLRTRVTSAGDRAWGMVFGLKALDDQIEPALEVLHDVLFAVNPRDKSRLQEVIVQALAGCRSAFVQGANRVAMLHAARNITPEGHLEETMNGVPQLPLLEGFATCFDDAYDDVASKIEAVRDAVLASGPMTASFTGSASALQVVRKTLSGWAGKLAATHPAPVSIPFVPLSETTCEGLAVPIQVAHCAQVVPAVHGSHADAPLLTLASALLRIDYMIQEIRFKGNAYGAYCSYADSSGCVILGSYADPHIVRTLKVFADMPAYIRDVPWTDVELDRAVISTAKADYRPIRPEAATGQALNDYMTGRTAAWRAERYERLLSATPAEVKRAILDVLDQNMSNAPICVASSREKLEAANAELQDKQLTIKTIL